MFSEITIEGRICLEPKILANGGGMFKLVSSKKKGEVEKDSYYVIFCSPGQVNLIETMGYKKGDTLIVRGTPELETKLDEKGNYIDKFSIREPNISFGLKAKGNSKPVTLETIAENLNMNIPKDRKLKAAIDEYLGLVPAKDNEEARFERKKSWVDYL